MNPPRRLLIRGVNWLGDAVMSMPALARLRQALPGTHIALLTADKLADLWSGHPSIDEVIPFSKRNGVGQLSRTLRAARFDTALIFPNSFRSAFESWLAGIPRRIGYAAPARTLLLTQVVPPRLEHVPMRKKSAAEIKSLIQECPSRPRETFPSSGHHLHQYLHLASTLGALAAPLSPSLPISDAERRSVLDLLQIPPAPLRVGLNPGAEYGPAKRWPLERFIAAGIKLHERSRPQFLIFGGPNDSAAAAQLETGIANAGATIFNLAGKTSLRQLAAALSACHTVLTNDTGPMHLAAAVGTPLVVPFGSTSPELTGPGAPRDPRHRLLLGDAPCAPCFLRVCPIDFRCMTSITADQILTALADLLPS